MASGPYADERRGTWAIQWFDGVKWRRKVVAKKRPGWKPGMPMPKKAPPEAMAALVEYQEKERVARSRASPTPEQTVDAFLEVYLETYARTREPLSTLELEKAARRFAEWCEGRGVTRVSGVTASVCHDWIADRMRMAAPATVAKERALLAAAWAAAHRRDEIEKNPWVAARIPGKRAPKEKGAWTPEEFQRLLEYCHPWLRDVLILGCNTGLRIHALRMLEWRDIVWAKPGAKGFGFVVVRPELDKAKRGYKVPMNEAAHDLLARRLIHRTDDHPYVLTGRKGGQISSRSLTDKAIRIAHEKAGLMKPKQERMDSPNHHMRRSFGRWAVYGQLTGEKVPMYVVSSWLGHSSLRMTQEYLQLDEADSTRFMVGGEDD